MRTKSTARRQSFAGLLLPLVPLLTPSFAFAAEPNADSIKALQSGISDLYSDKVVQSIPQLEAALTDSNWSPLEKGSILRLLGDANAALSEHSKSFKCYSCAVESLGSLQVSELSDDDLSSYNSELSSSLIGKSRSFYGFGASGVVTADVSKLCDELKKGIELSCTSAYEDDLLLCGATKNPYLVWELGRVNRDAKNYSKSKYYFDLASKIFKSQGDDYRSFVCKVDRDLMNIELTGESSTNFVIEPGVKELKSREIVYVLSVLKGDKRGVENALDFEGGVVESQKRGWTIDDSIEMLKGGRSAWVKDVGVGIKGKVFSS